ncbi:glycosyltransferase family 4 protein [Rhizobium sp. YAF28]|jgi:glycosyltransferase involved in cell wall biosynthesis|uniref:glycosyltransferase family 4 protein n=1 Tax=Rhizobium sp. YAF28 TaxID=3233081 RepID=UPI003F9B9C4A
MAIQETIDMAPDDATDLSVLPLKGRKVLIVVENLPVPFDRRVWQEARTLTAAGAQVCVICPTGKGFTERYECIEGIHVYRHPLPLDASGALGYLLEYGVALFWETVLAWKIFFRHGFDTVHGCNPPDLIFLVAWQFRLFGVPYIFDHHDINPELYEAKYEKRGFFWRLMCCFEWITFKSARVVISTNESYREIAQVRGGKKAEDIYVVRSGPDLSRFVAVEPNEALKKGRKYLVGYVGVMGAQEGVDILLDAVAYIKNQMGRDDIQFVLVGGGPSAKGLAADAERMGLAECVTFTGRVSDHDLLEVLSTSDVCVNPDRVNPMNDKSTMNKIIEYMALGKPIVQFDVTEGRRSAEEASLYAKANDAKDFAEKIVALLENPEERARMGAIGRKRVASSLAWPYQIPNLIAAYKKVKRQS